MGRDRERDRISLDLKGLRERLESAVVEPGQSLASVIRRVAHLGLELLEACAKLKIPPPALGEVEKWLTEISKVKNETSVENLPNLLSRLSIDEIMETNIPLDRIVAIRNGEYPEPHEITKLARVLNRTPSQIKHLIEERHPNGSGC